MKACTLLQKIGKPVLILLITFCTLYYSCVLLRSWKTYSSVELHKSKTIKSNPGKEKNSKGTFDPFARISTIIIESQTLEPNCFKKHENQTYKICKDLPYSEIKCGPKNSQSKLETNGPFQVPDVVFFVWFGSNLQFRFYNYLALRSAAAIQRPERIDFYYSITLPVGKFQKRRMNQTSNFSL